MGRRADAKVRPKTRSQIPSSRGRLARATASATSSGDEMTIVVKGSGSPRAGGVPPSGAPDVPAPPVALGTPPPARGAPADDAAGVAPTEGSAALDDETVGRRVGSESGVADTDGSTGTDRPPGVGTGSGRGRPRKATTTAGNTERSLVFNGKLARLLPQRSR